MLKTANFAHFTRQVFLPAICLAFAGTAHAQDAQERDRSSDFEAEGVLPLFAADPIFRDGLTGYESLDGQSFFLKRRGNETLFRFDGQQEIWALESVPGPRGDEFLKNDVGRVFVRLTDLGGVILFDPDHPKGQPVDPLDYALPIDDPTPQPDLQNNLTAYLTLRIGKPLAVQLQNVSEVDSVWIQDAAKTAAEGLVRSEKEARNLVETLVVKTGPEPDLELGMDGELIVSVNVGEGYHGRPSSDRVSLFLKNRLSS